VTLDDTIPSPQPRGIEVLALNEALESLAKIDQRKVRAVELRYFGGLNLNESAAVLGISVETAKRDWRIAKSLLRLALSGGGEQEISSRDAL
jgi:DNA-directed RNA polymerase specialized sigma24 family protein